MLLQRLALARMSKLRALLTLCQVWIMLVPRVCDVAVEGQTTPGDGNGSGVVVRGVHHHSAPQK